MALSVIAGSAIALSSRFGFWIGVGVPFALLLVVAITSDIRKSKFARQLPSITDGDSRPVRFDGCRDQIALAEAVALGLGWDSKAVMVDEGRGGSIQFERGGSSVSTDALLQALYDAGVAARIEA